MKMINRFELLADDAEDPKETKTEAKKALITTSKVVEPINQRKRLYIAHLNEKITTAFTMSDGQTFFLAESASDKPLAKSDNDNEATPIFVGTFNHSIKNQAFKKLEDLLSLFAGNVKIDQRRNFAIVSSETLDMPSLKQFIANYFSLGSTKVIIDWYRPTQSK